INGELKSTEYSEPFSYDWRELRSGLHTIQVKAFDKAGNNATTPELEVMRWRFHTILVILLLIFADIMRNRPRITYETMEDEGDSRSEINHFRSFFSLFR
ncbi:MAG: hypothetical protein R6V50_06720, partial [Thermoplasmatota archaeon]